MMTHEAPSAQEAQTEPLGDGKRFLVISSFHDFRSPRWANLHFIADELSRRGTTRFFSFRFSRLSARNGDPRHSLHDRANRVERCRDVDCYLWKTPLHPFNSGWRAFRPLEAAAFAVYRQLTPRLLRDWVRDSDMIVFESGITPLLMAQVMRWNPNARTVYRASDDLQTINVAATIQRAFAHQADRLDALALPSSDLVHGLPVRRKAYFVPHGLDPDIAKGADPSPYSGGVNAVSVGSMLFDPTFFVVAGERFPDIRFHVIGSGQARSKDYPDNIIVYDEMPHAETLRYIKHADIGLAPYRHQQLPAYLADTSMKLMQYDFFGVPAVCPETVVGDYCGRFGFRPGEPDTIACAIRHALQARPGPSRDYLSWREVVNRLIAPENYPDTRLPQ